MDFISNSDIQNAAMLKSIGIHTIDELFCAIPESLRLKKPQIDDGLSEYEGLMLMQKLAQKNTYHQFDNYLGGGSYEHYIPALVASICSKSEFLTSYTPYQAEASQGMLQVIFEYQSALCALTGMDVSNASLYDGASACAEACLMAMRLKKDKSKLLVAKSLNPHYRSVVDLYLKSHAINSVDVPFDAHGKVDQRAFNDLLREQDTIGFLVQSPNFLGVIEDIAPLSQQLHEKDALLMLVANPLSYGLYACPQELDVDIAVGDCQPFGLPLSFGGPYVGYLTCKNEYLRQMPGRIVGETLDTKGQRGFVLTLQAREQHIRREKATSNICTNQALAALASLVTLAWYGKEGLKALALTNYQRACYLQQALSKLPGVKLFSQGAIFNEFALNFGRPLSKVQALFRQHHIEPGIDLGAYDRALENHLLVTVTETKTKEQLDRYIEIAKECLKS